MLKQPQQPFIDFLASSATSQYSRSEWSFSLSSLSLLGTCLAAELSEAYNLWGLGRGSNQARSQTMQRKR